MYAYYLVSQEHFDQAVSKAQKAIEIDPNSLANQVTYGIVLYYAHRFDEAIVQLKRVLEKDPNLVKAHFFIWLLYDLKGDAAQAYE